MMRIDDALRVEEDALRVEEVTLTSELDRYRQPWRALHSRSADADLFNSFEWLRAWLAAFWGDRPISFRFVWRGSELVGLLPLLPDRRGELACRGVLVTAANLQTPRLNLLTSGQDAAILRAALRHEAGRSGRVRFVFQRLADDSEATGALRSAAATTGLRTITRRAAASPFIRFGGTWSDYLEQRTGKLRHELRRKRRRFFAEEGSRWRVLRVPDEVDEAIRAVMEIERESWKEAEGTSFDTEAGLADFYRDLARRLADVGMLEIYLLEVGDRPVAHVYCAAYGATLYALKTSYRGDQSRLSPGAVIIGLMLENACAAGYEVVDLLGAQDGWKTPLATDVHELRTVCVASRVAPRCYGCWLLEEKVKPLARRRLPGALRGRPFGERSSPG